MDSNQYVSACVQVLGSSPPCPRVLRAAPAPRLRRSDRIETKPRKPPRRRRAEQSGADREREQRAKDQHTKGKGKDSAAQKREEERTADKSTACTKGHPLPPPLSWGPKEGSRPRGGHAHSARGRTALLDGAGQTEGQEKRREKRGGGARRRRDAEARTGAASPACRSSLISLFASCLSAALKQLPVRSPSHQPASAP
jgi:hypothetical protein